MRASDCKAGSVLTEAERPIRAFISYTQSDEVHARWVKDIATVLRENGIDARLDVWHLRPGMDVAQWMANELDLADRVVLVCDEKYTQKADRRHGGVGWEIRLVQGELLQSQADNPDKFIPLFRTESAESAPAFLKSVLGIHCPPSGNDDRSRVQDLIKAINRAEEQAPPLGAKPSFAVRRA